VQERDLDLRRYRSSLFACRTRWPFGRRFGQCHADPLALRPRVSRDHVDLAYRRLAVDLGATNPTTPRTESLATQTLLVWVSEDRSHLRGLTGNANRPAAAEAVVAQRLAERLEHGLRRTQRNRDDRILIR
jgi:hypothetical protein